MKKTIVMLLLLLTFVSTAFAKLQVPEDQRWGYLAGDKTKEDFWMDLYTFEFGKSLKSDYNHKDHKFARIWFLRNVYSADNKVVMFYEFDLQCRTVRRLSATGYDGNGNVLFSLPASYTEEAVIPNTFGEIYLSIALGLEKIHNDKEKLEEFYKVVQEDSEKYRKL